MTNKIVAISIDKVQKFLYHAITGEGQENQMDSGTLRSIMGASRIISDHFYREICEEERGFSGQIGEVLLQCSGMYVFTTALDRKNVMGKLKSLFEKYYREFNGQLLLKYVCFEQKIRTDQDKIRAVKEAKKRLRAKECLNDIIESNQELLFSFQGVTKRKPYQEDGGNHTAFVSEINQLYPKQEDAQSEYFRIAVIKADIDGMGSLFEKINDYSTYRAVSNILSEHICLTSLEEKAEKMKGIYSDFQLYPLYAAGDDILFAVAVRHLISAVELCRKLIGKVNDAIRKQQSRVSPLSLSIGIEFTINREPIRYYYERVQRQLDMAKKAKDPRKKEDKETWPCTKICINQGVFFAFERENMENKQSKEEIMRGNILQWSHFMHSVKVLKIAMAQGFKAHYFLYGLLQKITDLQICNDERKLSNEVLYHLLPRYLEGADKKLREAELLLIGSLLKRVTIKKERNWKMNFGKEQRRVLEVYTRLLLLFSDDRFQIVKETITEQPGSFDRQTIMDIRRTVFNRVLSYLYESSLRSWYVKHGKDLEQVNKMRGFFVKRVNYQNASGSPVMVYVTLSLSDTMIFRMKTLGIHIEKDAQRMEDANGIPKEEHRRLAQERIVNHKAPPKMYFEKEAFIRAARETGMWTKDYLDSLLVFYRYNNLLIRYRTIYPTKQNEQKKGRKR